MIFTSHPLSVEPNLFKMREAGASFPSDINRPRSVLFSALAGCCAQKLAISKIKGARTTRRGEGQNVCNKKAAVKRTQQHREGHKRAAEQKVGRKKLFLSLQNFLN